MKGPVLTVSMPVPWHCGQLSGLVPASAPVPLHLTHSSVTVTESSLLHPLAASEKLYRESGVTLSVVSGNDLTVPLYYLNITALI